MTLQAAAGVLGSVDQIATTLFGESSTQNTTQDVTTNLNSTTDLNQLIQTLASTLQQQQATSETNQQATTATQSQQQQQSTQQQDVLQQLLESIARTGTQTQTTTALGEGNLAAGNEAVQQISQALTQALGSDRLSRDAAIGTATNARDAAIQQVLQSGIGNIFGQVSQSGAFDSTAINQQANDLAASAATAGAAQELATINTFEQQRQGEIQGLGALLAQTLGQLTGAQTTSESTFTEDTSRAQDSTTASTSQEQATATSEQQQQQQASSQTAQQSTTATQQESSQQTNSTQTTNQTTDTSTDTSVLNEEQGLLDTLFG